MATPHKHLGLGLVPKAESESLLSLTSAALPKFETKQRDERVMLQSLMTDSLTEFEKLDRDAKPRLMSKIYTVEDLYDPKTNTLSCYVPTPCFISPLNETIRQSYLYLSSLLNLARDLDGKITTLIIESDFLVYVSKDDLKYILDRAKSIKCISFGANLYDNKIDIDKISLILQFTQKCPNLDTIYFERMNRNEAIKLGLLEWLLRRKKLERLSLGMDEVRTDEEFLELCNLIAVLPTLKVLHLNIRNLNLFLRNKKNSPVFFQALMNLKNLSALDLSETTYKSGFEIDRREHDKFASEIGPQLMALAKHPKIEQLKFTQFPEHHAEEFFRMIGNVRIIQFCNRKDEKRSSKDGASDFLQQYLLHTNVQPVKSVQPLKPEDRGDVKSRGEDEALRIDDTNLLNPYSNDKLGNKAIGIAYAIYLERLERARERKEWEEREKMDEVYQAERKQDMDKPSAPSALTSGERRDFEPGDSKSKSETP